MTDKMTMPNKIAGEHIYLRPITYQDSDLIIKWRNQENVRKFFIYQKDFTKEGQKRWMMEQIEPGHAFQFIVCENENDRPIGCTYLRDYDENNHKAEYGVFIGEESMRGKGLGKEMLNLTLKFAYEHLHLHKVFARALADNPASINCFLACGFEKEAHLRDEVRIENAYQDVIFLGKINPKEA